MTTLIAESSALSTLIARVADAPWVALDTEFTRIRTYYARLALLQVATADGIVCVDPLAVDIAPLLDALYQPQLLKIVHAGRQDLEVFYDLRGDVPRPVFDTQVAAALVGFPEQMGYGPLVEAITGVTLAKLHTRTDWEQRPLTDAQLVYAADDVRYLPELRRALVERLQARNRLHWLDEECAALTDAGLYNQPPAAAYRRVKEGIGLAPTAQQALQRLAEWRERTARQRDLPRNWVVPDATLVELARRQPASMAALAATSVTPAACRRWGQEILAAIQAPTDDTVEWRPPRPLTPAEQSLTEQFLQRLRALAQTEDINIGVLASRRAVVELVRDGAGALTRGWRYELIGRELLAARDDALADHGRGAGNST